MDPQEKILFLTQKIEQHNIDYYVYDNPKISDSEYDKLLRELESIEKEYPQFSLETSPTKRIGAQPTSKFKTIEHSIPMLSLANAMNHQELIDFDLQIKKLLNTNNSIEYSMEPKLDGLAVEVVYKDGQFIYGSTRGDGVKGEDVSLNLKTIKAIPLKLLDSDYDTSGIIEFRGEVFINHADFKKLNQSIAKTFLHMANKYEHIPMPGYTHLQRAMPSSWGLWFSSYAESFIDNIDLINSTIDWIDSNPLGSAAGYGVALPLDRKTTTKELGFKRMQLNQLKKI